MCERIIILETRKADAPMNKSNKTKATRKIGSALRHVEMALELLRDAGDILPSDQQVGLQRALEKVAGAAGQVREAGRNAGKTFDEVYPPAKVETLEDRVERQNNEALSSMGMQ
jgi:hypothetical protein